jgi:hypothetical protein
MSTTSGIFRTDVFTFFTQADGQVKPLYSVNQESWAFVRLRLESAGPVAVGTRSDIAPITSGKGILLPIGDEVQMTLPPGTRLYIIADAVNRVAVIIEPIAWQEEIFKAVGGIIKPPPAPRKQR